MNFINFDLSVIQLPCRKTSEILSILLLVKLLIDNTKSERGNLQGAGGGRETKVSLIL